MKSTFLVLLLLGLTLYTNATTCGGNCPSGKCNTCYCGSSSSYVDIASACSQYSGWSQTHCQCIAKHESGGNAHAQLHNTNGSDDVGLWQINSSNWSSCSGGSAPCSVSANLACAKKVFGWGGNTWKYWSTCGSCGACGSKEEEEMLAWEANHGQSHADLVYPEFLN